MKREEFISLTERLEKASVVLRNGGALLLLEEPAMTVRNSPRESVEDIAKSMKTANAFFLAHLAKIVGDMSGLTEGDNEFDYFVPVPLADLHAVSQRIADLEFTVKERFEIGVSALPIPIAG